MKIAIVDGAKFNCPMYLVRAGTGWQVRVPDQQSRFFSDGIHGSTAKAFHEAMAYRKKLLPITEQCRVLPGQEKANKLHPTGEPGVFLNKKMKRDQPMPEYAFSITRPGLPRTTVYIGTESTWEQNYDAKLIIAINLRRQAIAQHIVKE